MLDSLQIIALIVAGSAVYFIYNSIAQKAGNYKKYKRTVKISGYKKNGITYYN